MIRLRVSKKCNNTKKANKELEIPKEGDISPEERQQVIHQLKLIQ